ncbi:hypothetical protein FALCPG4_19034 [Fusarium falciforme]
MKYITIAHQWSKQLPPPRSGRLLRELQMGRRTTGSRRSRCRGNTCVEGIPTVDKPPVSAEVVEDGKYLLQAKGSRCRLSGLQRQRTSRPAGTHTVQYLLVKLWELELLDSCSNVAAVDRRQVAKRWCRELELDATARRQAEAHPCLSWTWSKSRT